MWHELKRLLIDNALKRFAVGHKIGVVFELDDLEYELTFDLGRALKGDKDAVWIHCTSTPQINPMDLN